MDAINPNVIKEAIANQKGDKHSTVIFERGSWYCRTKIIDNYGQIKHRKRGGFKTQQEAEEAYYKHKEEFEKEYRKIKLSTDKNISFMDYLLYWHENIYSKRAAISSMNVAEHCMKYLVFPYISESVRLKDVNVEFLDTLLVNCSRRNPSAAEECRSILNIAFNDAISYSYISFNPVPYTKSYKKNRKPFIIYTKEEVKALLKAAYHSNWYLEILLALFCGLRKSEIYGLKFSDFDIEKKTVNVCRQYVNDSRKPPNATQMDFERPPKTENSIRKLKVPTVIIDELQKRQKEYQNKKEKYKEEFNDYGYISCQNNGNGRTSSSFNTALGRICSNAGLKRISVHTLRHMYATILIERGAPLSKISAALGHSSVDTTFQYYCDISDEAKNIKNYIDNNFVVEES